MEFHTRAADDADALDLIGLVARCWSQYPGCVLDVHGEEPELLTPAASIAERDGRWWVAEAGPRLVGSVAFEPGADGSGWLRKLYVDPTVRRQGLGQRLVALVEQEAAARAFRRIELWSDTRFTDAHRLYERLGYECLPDTRALGDLSKTIEHHFAKDLASGDERRPGS